MTTIDEETKWMFPFFTEEVRDKVIAIVKADLEGAPFLDKFALDEIVVEPRYDPDEEESLLVHVVYGGRWESLDPDWTAGMVGRIRPKMIAQGLPGSVLKSFVEKEDWELRDRYRNDNWDDYDEVSIEDQP